MGFNMHGLAFKQSMMTLVGFSIVFATLFGVDAVYPVVPGERMKQVCYAERS